MEADTKSAPDAAEFIRLVSVFDWGTGRLASVRRDEELNPVAVDVEVDEAAVEHDEES